MVDVNTDSYPKPQPPVNPFDTITKFGQAADVMGNVAAGKAVQGAVQPDGSIDQNALTQGLVSTPAGSMKALQTMTAFQQLRQAGHVADIAGLDNFQKRMTVVNHLFGQLAAQDNPSIQDVNSIAARVLDPALQADKFGLTFPVVMNALKNFRGPDGRPLPAAQIKQRALELQTMTADTSTQLEALHPGYEAVDDGTNISLVPKGNKINPMYPVVPKRIPVGTPQMDTDPSSPTYRQSVLTPPQRPVPPSYINPRTNAIEGPSANFGGYVTGAAQQGPTTNPQTGQPLTQGQSFDDLYRSRIAGAPAAGLKPGVAEAATSTAKTSADLGNALTTAANEVPATKGILDNLDRTLANFTPGPGADYRRFGKALANTVIPDSLKDKLGFDPKSISSQEEFNKLGYQLAQNQFQALGGTGTDSKLHSTMMTSPSELLSQEGNKNIISLLRGNNDALQVKAREWNKWKKTNGEDSYAEFSDQFNQNFNPRVFQFKYVPPADRQNWYKTMSPQDRDQFKADLDYADAKKWIKP
jgi:hypothetical protein